MKFILGTKIEMSQIFDKEGKVIPVTLIEAGPCSVTQVKTKVKDKYTAVQIGFLPKKKRIKKTEKGKEFRFLREYRIQDTKYKIQDTNYEYPQYTRPEKFKKWRVPKILLSGNHKKIGEWRKNA